MKINIKADNKQLEARIRDVALKQIPFAMSKSLNKTTKYIRDTPLKRYYAKTFEMRDKAFFNQVHSIAYSSLPFTKQHGIAVTQIKQRKAPQVVGTKPQPGGRTAYTGFMTRHVTGGVKLPKGSKLAIPVGSAKTKTKTGKTRKAMRPAAIMHSGRGVILANDNSLGSTMYRKMGRGKNAKLKPIYTLSTGAKIKKVYDPMPIVKQRVRFVFPYNFRVALVQAIKTARF